MRGYIEHTAIILAGGKSVRMGEDKGLMLVNNKPMIQGVIDAVLPLTPTVLIAANNPNYEKFGFPVISDMVKDKGPLAGLVNGLSHSSSELNWVISCDTPYLQTSFLIELMNQIEGFDAVVPVYEGKTHPLIAVYRKSSLKHFEENLALNRLKMMDLLNGLKVNYFNANTYDSCNFKNLNSKAEL